MVKKEYTPKQIVKKLGETYKYLNVVDYVIDPQKCLDAGITITPTWIIGEQKITGVRSLEQLKQLTGC